MVDKIIGVGSNVISTSYKPFGAFDSVEFIGFTYGTLDESAGTTTFIGTLVKNTEYDQFRNDASTTIFTLAAKDDWIAFKTPADGITAPTAAQIAVADNTIKVEVDTEYTDGIKFVAVEKSTEPIPELPEDETEAQKKIAEVIGGAIDATELAKLVTDRASYNAFRAWAQKTGTDPIAAEAAVLLSPNAAVSFQLSPIVEGATLFEEEPTVEFTAIAQNGTSWNATMELKDGDVEVQLAAEATAAYAKFVKVGTQVTAITQAAEITAAVKDTTDGKQIVLTITPPTGNAGFIKFTTAE